MQIGRNCRSCSKSPDDVEVCVPCFKESLSHIFENGCMFCTRKEESIANPDFCVDCYINYDRDNWPLDDLITISYLVDGLSYLINGKDHGNFYYVKPLASLFFTYLNHNYSEIKAAYKEIFNVDIDYITIIPSNRKINHLDKIITHFDESLWEDDYPFVKLLKIQDDSEKQKNKAWEERRTYKADKYVLDSHKDITGKNIIIFDDVYTRGGTLNSAAVTLKNNGANKVFGLVLSRTVKNDNKELVKDRANENFDFAINKFNIGNYKSRIINYQDDEDNIFDCSPF